MKPYADLHICPNLDDSENASAMASLLVELEVSAVGIVVPPERLTPPPAIIDLFKSAGLDVARRVNLKARSREQLLWSLRRFRGRYEVIAVECDTPSVSRVAVRDRRVDIVHFPRKDRASAFRGSLVTTCRAAIEVCLSEVVSGPSLPSRLQSIRREIEAAQQSSIAVVGSTGASSPYGLKSPRDIAALLHLEGLPLEAALSGVSKIPLEIVRKNRLRLEEPQLEQGVRVLRRSA